MLLGIVQAWIAAFVPHQAAVCKIEWEGKIESVMEEGKVWWVWHGATGWFARSRSAADFRPGDWVRIVDRQGSTLIIEPWEPHQ